MSPIVFTRYARTSLEEIAAEGEGVARRKGDDYDRRTDVCRCRIGMRWEASFLLDRMQMVLFFFGL